MIAANPSSTPRIAGVKRIQRRKPVPGKVKRPVAAQHRKADGSKKSLPGFLGRDVGDQQVLAAEAADHIGPHVGELRHDDAVQHVILAGEVIGHDAGTDIPVLSQN